MSAEEEKMKLAYMKLEITDNDGMKVHVVSSEVRGDSLDECLVYTKKLQNLTKRD